MSLFGDTPSDFRDFRMGLAGLTAGIHALRILAEKGIASPGDIAMAREGIMGLLIEIPDSEFDSAKKAGIAEMLDKIAAVAGANAAD